MKWENCVRLFYNKISGGYSFSIDFLISKWMFRRNWHSNILYMYLLDIWLTYADFKGYLWHTIVSIDVQHVGREDLMVLLRSCLYRLEVLVCGVTFVTLTLCFVRTAVYNVQYYILFFIHPFKEWLNFAVDYFWDTI